MVLQPKVDRGEPEGTAIKELAKDPYIVIAAGIFIYIYLKQYLCRLQFT